MNAASKYIFLFSLLIFISCNNDQYLPEDKKTEISAEVRETLNNYCNDVRKQGLTAEFAYLDSSKDFFWVPPGFITAISYDSVAQILTKNAKLFSSVDNRYDTLRVVAISAGIATYTARISSSMTLINGKSSTLTMLETGTVVKRENGWKLLCGQTTMLSKPTE